MTLRGNGNAVVGFPVGYRAPFVVAAQHNGSGTFTVTGLTSKKIRVSSLIDRSGPYQGQILEDEPLDDLFDVVADGEWALTFAPVSSVDRFTASIAGTGDRVVSYEGGNGTAHITHSGTSNFVIRLGTSLVLDTVGPYDGSVTLTAGPTTMEIVADGSWTVTIP